MDNPDYCRQIAHSKLKELLEVLPKDRTGKPICPYCGSGSGKHHTSSLQFNANEGSGKPICYCHRCRVKFDAISLYQYLHNTSYLQAIEALSGQSIARKHAGSTQEAQERRTEPKGQNYRHEPQNACQSTPEQPGAKSEDKPGAAAPSAEQPEQENAPKVDYSDFFTTAAKVLQELPKGEEGRQYLTARQISREAAELFHLGYSYLYKTIIIPALNGSYVSRAIAEEIHTAEPEHAQKIRYKVKGEKDITASEGALEKPLVFIAEGAFDAMAIFEAVKSCFPAKLAYSGFIALNSVTTANRLIERLQAVEKKPLTAVICLDSDKPGAEAAAELAKELEAIGIYAKRTAIAAPYKDPAEALKNGDISAIAKAILAIMEPAEAETARAEAEGA